MTYVMLAGVNAVLFIINLHLAMVNLSRGNKLLGFLCGVIGGMALFFLCYCILRLMGFEYVHR